MINTKQVNKTLNAHQIENKQINIIKSELKWETFLENQDLNWKKIYTNVIS